MSIYQHHNFWKWWLFFPKNPLHIGPMSHIGYVPFFYFFFFTFCFCRFFQKMFPFTAYFFKSTWLFLAKISNMKGKKGTVVYNIESIYYRLHSGRNKMVTSVGRESQSRSRAQWSHNWKEGECPAYACDHSIPRG